MRTEFRYLSGGDPPEELYDTMIYIDYESLFIGMNSQFSVNPDLKQLVADFRSVCRIMDIKVFGDFTKQELSNERNRVRTITNFLIDCGSESEMVRKDFTDFIMLDHIYQDIVRNAAIKQFILVTGDGHFHSVATFLRMYMDKPIGIYSLPRSLSHQLRDCASWVRVIDVKDDNEEEYARRILANLKQVEEAGKIATFRRTCEVISNSNRYGYETCRYVLSKMITDGIIDQELVDSLGDTPFQRLVVNWERAKHLIT